MAGVQAVEGVLRGPVVQARNWSADTQGSIHDDATASKLGFRGGTVAGNIHMDQFVPVLLEAFGEEWFRSGNLSLRFMNATTDGEPVIAHVREPRGATQVDAWMLREDGLEVARGTAGIGDPSKSALRTADLRPCDPASLRILGKLGPGHRVGPFPALTVGERQREILAKGWVSDALDWYESDSPWGGPVASPSALVQLLWGPATEAMRRDIGRSVGLFGSIEVGHVEGPVFLDRPYTVSAEVVAVGESPKTEVLWFDSTASDEDGRPVAAMRMQLRFMKASSKLYMEARR